MESRKSKRFTTVTFSFVDAALLRLVLKEIAEFYRFRGSEPEPDFPMPKLFCCKLSNLTYDGGEELLNWLVACMRSGVGDSGKRVTTVQKAEQRVILNRIKERIQYALDAM